MKEAGLLSDDPNNMDGMENHPLLAAGPAKKRGRPPGSKNKKTLEAIQLKAETGGLEPVAPPVDPIPEEAVSAAAAASGILEITPSRPCTSIFPLEITNYSNDSASWQITR